MTKTNSERQWIQAVFKCIDKYGTLDDLQTLLNEAFLESNPINGQWRNLHLDQRDDYYGESSELWIVGERQETDKEFNTRLQQEATSLKAAKIRQASKREKDLKELARLKAKYEDNKE